MEVTDGGPPGNAPSEAIVKGELGLLELSDAVLGVLEVQAMVEAADAGFEKEAGIGVGAEGGEQFARFEQKGAGATGDGDKRHGAFVVDELTGWGEEVGENPLLVEGHAEAKRRLDAPIKTGALLDMVADADVATGAEPIGEVARRGLQTQGEVNVLGGECGVADGSGLA